MDVKELAIDAIYESGVNCEWVEDILMHFIELADYSGKLGDNTIYFTSDRLHYYFKQHNGELILMAISHSIAV